MVSDSASSRAPLLCTSLSSPRALLTAGNRLLRSLAPGEFSSHRIMYIYILFGEEEREREDFMKFYRINQIFIDRNCGGSDDEWNNGEGRKESYPKISWSLSRKLYDV